MPGEFEIFIQAEVGAHSRWLNPLGIVLGPMHRAERRLINDVTVRRAPWLYGDQTESFPPDDIPMLEHSQAAAYYGQLYAEMLHNMMEKGHDPRRLFVGNPQGQKILDFGCGNGQMTRGLVSQNSVWGLDISPQLVAEARESGINASVINADDEALPYPEDFFNLVYAFDVFEHLFNPEQVLERLRKVMKGMGLLIVTVPVLRSSTLRDNVSFHKQIITAIGKTDDPLAAVEPEAGVKTLPEWVSLFSHHGFQPLSRAFGYTWDDKATEDEKRYLFMHPDTSGDVCLVLHHLDAKILPYDWTREQYNLEAVRGALTTPEFLTGLRIYPSPQAAVFSSSCNT